MFSALAIFALLGGVASWPELVPNCGVLGNWTDDTASVGVTVQNISSSIFGNMYWVKHVVHNTCYSGLTFSKDHRIMFLYASNSNNFTQELYMSLACYGNQLWVMDIPLGNNPIPTTTRVFTLSKISSTPTPPTSPDAPGVTHT